MNCLTIVVVHQSSVAVFEHDILHDSGHDDVRIAEPFAGMSEFRWWWLWRTAVLRRGSEVSVYRNEIIYLDGTVLKWMRVAVVRKGLRKRTILVGEGIHRARARHRCSRCNSGGQW